MQINQKARDIIVAVTILAICIGLVGLSIYSLISPSRPTTEYKEEDKISIPKDDELFKSADAEILAKKMENHGDAIADQVNEIIANNSHAEISQMRLFGNGEWCGVTVKYYGDSINIYDEYRIILEYSAGHWYKKTELSLSLSYAEYPDIPRGLIRLVNQM